VPLKYRYRFVEALFLSFKLGDHLKQIHLDSFSRLRANSIDAFDNVMREAMFSADVQDQSRLKVSQKHEVKRIFPLHFHSTLVETLSPNL
jgi:hypothetical protein